MADSSHKDTTADKRPVSPHLQIYRWQWTMVLSIAHRLTGLYLCVGVVFLSVKIVILSFFDADSFGFLMHLAVSRAFFVLKVIFIWCLLYHMLNGVRHLFWDTGRGLGLRAAALSGYTTVLFSLLLVVLYLRYWL